MGRLGRLIVILALLAGGCLVFAGGAFAQTLAGTVGVRLGR